MSKRIKAPFLSSRAEFDDTVNRCVEIRTKLDLVEARKARAQQRINALFGAKSEPLETELKQLVTQAEKYADANREALLPTKAKSATTALGIFGYRTGNPTTKTVSKKWTWDTVVEALRANKLTAYIVPTFAPAKSKILSDHKDNILVNDDGKEIALASVGVVIDQSEVFYIEPKTEGTTSIKAEAA